MQHVDTLSRNITGRDHDVKSVEKKFRSVPTVRRFKHMSVARNAQENDMLGTGTSMCAKSQASGRSVAPEVL